MSTSRFQFLLRKDFVDPAVAEVFRELERECRDDIFLGFEGKHVELSLAGAVAPGANYRIRHGLGFAPRDVIQTFFTTTAASPAGPGPAVLAWNYSSFDSEFIDVIVTGPVGSSVTVRAFIGKYSEG